MHNTQNHSVPIKLPPKVCLAHKPSVFPSHSLHMCTLHTQKINVSIFHHTTSRGVLGTLYNISVSTTLPAGFNLAHNHQCFHHTPYRCILSMYAHIKKTTINSVSITLPPEVCLAHIYYPARMRRGKVIGLSVRLLSPRGLQRPKKRTRFRNLMVSNWISGFLRRFQDFR